MSIFKIYHIVPASGGEWAIRAGEEEQAAGLYPSQGLAVARAWELTSGETIAEVYVHSSDGAVVSNLSIRRGAGLEEFDEAEDEALRREAERITPSRSALERLIDRLPPSKINYDEEDAELPC